MDANDIYHDEEDIDDHRKNKKSVKIMTKAAEEKTAVKGKETTKEYGKILYVSQSGKGKTYSFRNMDEDTTGFINTELKTLPFKKNFKYHGKPKNIASTIKCLKDYSENPEIKCIVVDSITAIFETFEKELSNSFSGYDLWAQYNRKVAEVLDIIKLAPKEVFVTSHYEVLNIEKAPEKRVKVLGKRWEGLIEKEFTIVLYADCKFNDENPEYSFKLSGEGTSAKCPPGIFGESVRSLPNDSAEVLKKVQEFYS